MFNFKSFLFFNFLFVLNVFANQDYHKNTLIGGRAATMAGSYVAISDDASGSFYNPSGLSLASGDSISGSANAYEYKSSTYEKSIGNKDWNRDSTALYPNFFGVVKKMKDATWALSYAMVDTFKETQSELYQDVVANGDNINAYTLNLDTDDRTFLIGPSWSKKINRKMNVGISLFYMQRDFRRNQNQFSDLSADAENPTDTDQEVSSSTTQLIEKGVRPVLGLMFSPVDKISIGAKLAYSAIIASKLDTYQTLKPVGSTVTSFLRSSSVEVRKTPLELSLGTAYFRSAYEIYSFDLDVFSQTDDDKKNVYNFSFGSEIFFNEIHAIRFGLYTNFTNTKTPDSSTTAPLEHVDLYGATVGWGYHTKGNVITLGLNLSQGKGEVQIFEGSSDTRNLSKINIGAIIASSYSF